jgi:hypothetical protein
MRRNLVYAMENCVALDADYRASGDSSLAMAWAAEGET